MDGLDASYALPDWFPVSPCSTHIPHLPSIDNTFQNAQLHGPRVRFADIALSTAPALLDAAPALLKRCRATAGLPRSAASPEIAAAAPGAAQQVPGIAARLGIPDPSGALAGLTAAGAAGAIANALNLMAAAQRRAVEAYFELLAGVRGERHADRAAAVPGLLRQLQRAATALADAVGRDRRLPADSPDANAPAALAGLALASRGAAAAAARTEGAVAALLWLAGAAPTNRCVVPRDVDDPAAAAAAAGRAADAARQRVVVASLRGLAAMAAADAGACGEIAAGLSGPASRPLLQALAAVMADDETSERNAADGAFWAAERAAAAAALLAEAAAARGERGVVFVTGLSRSRELLTALERALAHPDAAAALPAGSAAASGGGGDGANDWQADRAGLAVHTAAAVRARRAEAGAAAARVAAAVRDRLPRGERAEFVTVGARAGLLRMMGVMQAWEDEGAPQEEGGRGEGEGGDEAAPRACDACGATNSTLLRCSGCRAAHYCGSDCAKRAWPLHKAFCKAEAARLKAAAGAASSSSTAAAAAAGEEEQAE